MVGGLWACVFRALHCEQKFQSLETEEVDLMRMIGKGDEARR